MKVKDLLKILKDVDPKRLIVLQKDSEGNDQSPADGSYLGR